MPCESSYLEASGYEIAISRVVCLLEELEGKPIDENHWNGYHPEVYSNYACDKQTGDALVKELCDKLQNTDVSKYSLEMQIWWRDHKKADKNRLEREMQEQKTKAEKDAALGKLTHYERKLLGL